jgi:GT2 family glycosyltransferase
MTSPGPLVADAPSRIVTAAAAPARAIDVSILVVTWNSDRWIGRCLRSLPAACGALSYEVIVHDNASRDTTRAAVTAAEQPAVVLMEANINHGFAGGLNRAIARARGRYLFLLNPDCEPAPGSIAGLAGHLDANRTVAAAVPLLIGEDGVPQREFQLRRLPTLSSLVAEILLLEQLLPNNRVTARYRYRDLDISSPQVIEQPAAAALMLRRSVVDAVGQFDERFAPAWFEDVDYCRRMAGEGNVIELVPAAVATHHGGASLQHVPYDEFVSVWYRNLFHYAKKWLRGSQVEALRWAIVAGALLRSGASLLGLRNGKAGRMASARAYLTVAGDALRRWKHERPSS